MLDPDCDESEPRELVMWRLTLTLRHKQQLTSSIIGREFINDNILVVLPKTFFFVMPLMTFPRLTGASTSRRSSKSPNAQELLLQGLMVSPTLLWRLVATSLPKSWGR